MPTVRRTTFTDSNRSSFRRPIRAAVAFGLVIVVSSCSSGSGGPSDEGLYESSRVHTFALDIDEADFNEMISSFSRTQEKAWVEAAVTIDGTEYPRVGVRLKGNSSLLKSIREDAEAETSVEDALELVKDPARLPFLVDLDRFVDGQNHFGEVEMAIRSVSWTTALNEAVALELLESIGLPAQKYAHVRFTLNGGDEQLRLVIQNPEDVWSESELGSGSLFKADATGDYSYRGSDPEAYREAWDQDAGSGDIGTLVEFLDFINNSNDETFAEELSKRLDVESFATYLAFHELIQNKDDIDGPGNNSYLYFDSKSQKATVVSSDHNMTFRVEVRSEEARDPASSANPLVRRFGQTPAFREMYLDELERLRMEMFASGRIDDILERLTALLRRDALDLVGEEEIAKEAAEIEAVAADKR